MGTFMQITVFSENPDLGEEAAEAAFSRIRELDSVLSDYDPDSELMRLTRQPAGTAIPVSNDLLNVLARAQEVSETSEGAFDITMAPLVRLWREARKNKMLPGEATIAKARSRSGFENLHLDPAEKSVTLQAPDMQLDLGGIGKGFAADEALSVLRARGVPIALVAAGGDLAIGDPPPGTDGWRVGISSGRSAATQTVVLKNAAISTSGDTEQFVEIDGTRYSHIVDPETGRGLTERIRVTVIAPSATSADSYATAISVMGSEEGQAFVESLPGVETLIVTATDSGEEAVYFSSGFPQPPR